MSFLNETYLNLKKQFSRGNNYDKRRPEFRQAQQDLAHEVQALRQAYLPHEPEAMRSLRLPRRENEEVRVAEQDGHESEEEVIS